MWLRSPQDDLNVQEQYDNLNTASMKLEYKLNVQYLFSIYSGTPTPYTFPKIKKHIFLNDYIPKAIPDTIWLLENFYFRNRPVSMTSKQLHN